MSNSRDIIKQMKTHCKYDRLHELRCPTKTHESSDLSPLLFISPLFSYLSPIGSLLSCPQLLAPKHNSTLTRTQFTQLLLTVIYHIPSTRCHVPCAMYHVPSTRYQVPGTRCQVPCTWYHVLCNICQLFPQISPTTTSAPMDTSVPRYHKN